MTRAISWVDDSGALTSTARAEEQPVLRPADPARMERWKQILGWYLGGPTDVSDPRTPEWRDDPRIIAALPGTEPLARGLAKSMERQLVTWDGVAEAFPYLARSSVRSVLLVGYAAQLPADQVSRLSALSVRQGCRLGLLVGADLPGLSFAAAKMRMGRLALSRTLALSEVHGVRTARTRLLEGEGYDVLTLAGHGDGAHLDLSDMMFCGLSQDQECLPDGTPVPKGCSPRRCKKVRDGERPVMRMRDVRAALVSILTCNAFDVAGDLYPSNVSLVLACLEGYAGYVLATLTPMDLGPEMHDAIMQSLSSEEALGALAAKALQFRTREGACVLVGDPDVRVQGSRTGVEDSYAASDQYRDEIRALPLTSSMDRASETIRLARMCATRQFQLNNAISTLNARAKAAQSHSDALSRLRDTTNGMNDKLWRLRYLNRLSEDNHGMKENEEETGSLIADIDEFIHQWDERFVPYTRSYLVDAFDRFTPILHPLHKATERTEEGQICSRCGSGVSTVRFDADDDEFPARLVEDCLVCGVLKDWEPSGLKVGVRSLGGTSPGAPAVFEVVWQGGGGFDHVPVHIVGYLRDKRMMSVLTDLVLNALPQAGRLELRIPLPEDSGHDLHIIRLLGVQAASAAFAHAYFTPTP